MQSTNRVCIRGLLMGNGFHASTSRLFRGGCTFPIGGKQTKHLIQQGLKQPLKLLGVFTMFNGLDVLQGNRYIKLSCTTYIRKILEGHGWQKPTHTLPISTLMNHDKTYMRELKLAVGPTKINTHALL